MEYVRKQFRGDVQRVDIMFAAYLDDSLKEDTRVGREVNVSEGTWKGRSKYQVTGKSFCV